MEARDPALSTGRPLGAARLDDALRLAPALLVLGVLFAGAVAGAVKVSLIPLGGGLGDATLANWRELFADPAFADGLLFTLRIAILSTAIAALAGTALALALRGRGTAIRSLAMLPVPVPHLLVAVVAAVWLAPGGVADRILGGLPVDLIRDSDGLGIVLTYAYKEAPFIALVLLGTLGESLARREEAAAVLGAGARQRFWWVTWPAIRGPLVLACIVVMAFAIGAFEVPLAVGPNYPPTLSTYAFEATQGDVLAGEARAAAALIVAGLISTALAVAAVSFARRRNGV